MKLLVAGLLYLLGLAFVVVGAPAALRGGRPYQPTALEELQRGEPMPAPDLALDGVLVRVRSLDLHRFEGRYYLPLVDAETARWIDDSASWVSPLSSGRGKVVVAVLSLAQVMESRLAWDERVTEPGSVAPYRLRGAELASSAWPAEAARFLEVELGLRPDQVLVIAQGENSFERAAAITAILMGLLFGLLGLRFQRSHARARERLPGEAAAQREPVEAERPPARRRLGWGGVLAACLGLGAMALRSLENLGRSAVHHGEELAHATGRALSHGLDEGAEALRRAADEPWLALAHGLDLASDAQSLAQVAELMRDQRQALGSLRLSEGVERYQREEDGAWHLVSATLREELDAPLLLRGEPARHRRWTQLPERASGEDTRLRLRPTQSGGYEILLEDVTGADGGAGTVSTLVLEAELRGGSLEVLEQGGELELALTAAGREALLRHLEQRFESGLRDARDGSADHPRVTLQASMEGSPRFLLRERSAIVLGASLELRLELVH